MTHFASRKNILVSAGETSGDIHAANLIKHLKELNPDLSFFGIGGERMQKEGVELLERMEKLSIIGVSQIFSKLKEIKAVYKKITARVRQTPPDAVILVDYPGFNLALAKSMKKRKIPVIYYITPQVWAWGGFRIHSIKKYIDKAIVILKFEESLFKKHGIDATFVGHPILDTGKIDPLPTRNSCGLDEKKMTLALLPGSRESEVKTLLPIMLKTAELILRQKEVQFLLLKNSSVKDSIYDEALSHSSLRIPVIKDNTRGCLSISDFAFTASGTVTLENALMERPMLITYKTSLLTFVLARIFIRISYIGLVNIIAGREIAPELIQYAAKPEKLASKILSIVSSKEKMEEQIKGLRQVKAALGEPGASLKAARIINDFI